MALGKGLLAALGRYLSKRALTLSEKDLDAVVYANEVEAEETGLQTVKLTNWGKSVLLNL